MLFPNLKILGAVLSIQVVAAMPTTLPEETQTRIASIANEVLKQTDVPSVSIAVARGGHVVYTGAFGWARLETKTPATPSMRYPIGSISKQFTAAAVVMLAEQRSLRLDDPVGRYVPDLGPAKKVTLRQLLAHTAGIRDYWPQDYVFTRMLQPATTREILSGWAVKPLDFEPGTKWQYSNTGYVLAGAAAEKVSGKPLFQFLRERVFVPLGMESVLDVDQGRLGDSDPVGYYRHGLGPARPAPKEGRGWLQAAGGLAMTATDLAKWDLALMAGKVLSPAGLRELTRENMLSQGIGTHYGLGLHVKLASERREWAHGGEISGFMAFNAVYPDQGLAIVALSNQDVTDAAEAIGSRIATLLLAESSPEAERAREEAQTVLLGLQQGRIDRTRLTPNGNAFISEQALEDFKTGLAPLGELRSLTPGRSGTRGGMITREYEARFDTRKLHIILRAMPDGAIEQFTVSPE